MTASNTTMKRKFTRRPKMQELIADGVPLRAIPTYDALSDFCDNKTGKTIVAVEKLAAILKVHRRTVERHLSALEDAGVIKRQHQRRTKRGRFSSCLCVVISFALFTVRHSGKRGKRSPIKNSLNRYVSTPLPPEGEQEKLRKKEAGAARRQEGYKWLFDR